MKIKGIGKKLSEKYGEELVAMVADYRQKNNIVDVILPTAADAICRTNQRSPENRKNPEHDTKRVQPRALSNRV